MFSRTVRNPNFIFSLIREDSGAGVIDIQLVRSEDIFQIVRRDFLITEVWAYLHSFFRDGKDAAAFADSCAVGDGDGVPRSCLLFTAAAVPWCVNSCCRQLLVFSGRDREDA